MDHVARLGPGDRLGEEPQRDRVHLGEHPRGDDLGPEHHDDGGVEGAQLGDEAVDLAARAVFEVAGLEPVVTGPERARLEVGPLTHEGDAT